MAAGPALALLPAAPSGASNGLACGAGGGSYYDGDYTAPSPSTGLIAGALASINTQVGNFCNTAPYNDSYSAWALIGDSGNGYAQAGYWWINGVTTTNPQIFSQYSDMTGSTGKNFIYQTGPTTGSGATHTYKAVYNPSDHKMGMWYDNTRIDETFYDPYSGTWGPNNWMTPNSPQFAGETHTIHDYVPGQSTVVYFSNTQVQITFSWAEQAYQPVSRINSDPAHWNGTSSYSCNTSQYCNSIWDF